MIIERMHIDGFGIFFNKGISGFGKGINILYGKNEAGKSTLLDFIRMTLFGYPRQTKDRRPPVYGGNHGGRIWLRTSGDEPLQLYRSGSGRNEPRIIINNSEHNGEQMLKRLIDYASDDLYRNIYAITLEELKSVDQLRQSGVEDKIFSVGMGLSGVDFGDFEKSLEDHASRYFRSGGKTQILITLVNEIDEKQKKVGILKGKLDEYNRLTKELDQTKEEQKNVKSERKKLLRLEALYSSYGKAYPYFVRYREAKEELEGMGSRTGSPSQLLEDYRELKRKEEALGEREEESRNEIFKLENDKNNIKIDDDLKQRLPLLEYLQSNIKIYEKALSDQKSLEQEITHSESVSDEIMKRLGTAFEKEKLLETEGTVELLNKGKAVAGEVERIDQAMERTQERIREIETLIEAEKGKVLRLEEEAAGLEVRDQETLRAAQLKIADLDTSFSKALNLLKQKTVVPNSYLRWVSGIMSLIVAGGGALLTQISVLAGVIMMVVGTGGILAVLFHKGFRRIPEEPADPADINRKKESLKNSIDAYKEFEKKREEIRNSINELEVRLESEKKSLATNQSLKDETIESWGKVLREFNLPEDLAPGIIPALINDIVKLKENGRNIRNALLKIDEIRKTIVEFEEKVSQIRQIDNMPSNMQKVHELIRELSDTASKCNEIEKTEQMIKKERETIKNIEGERVRINKGKDAILKKAEADDETGLYKIFEEQEKADSLERELKSAESGIKSICGHDNFDDTVKFLSGTGPEEISLKLDEYNTRLQECESRYSSVTTIIGSMAQQIDDLLKPDEMYDLQNQVEALKTRLREETCEWLATKMAIEILTEAKQKYEEEKQPAVITSSGDYFRKITDSGYIGLKVSLGDKHVSLQDKSGVSKTVSELSRGTREQLLLALRMGLISEYEKNAEPLPVVLDDVMVNFDPERAQNTARALYNFAGSRQVLIFTCHPSTIDLFRSYEHKLLEW